MEAPTVFVIVVTLLALAVGLVLFSRCKCSPLKFRSRDASTPQTDVSPAGHAAEHSKKGKHGKKPQKTQIKANQHSADATRTAEPQTGAQSKELFVDFVKGVNRPVDCIAIAPHAHLIATTTADAKVHVAMDTTSTYFLNFREDAFSALDFWCKEKQLEGSAFFCGAMVDANGGIFSENEMSVRPLMSAAATDGRMVSFEIKFQDRKISGIREVGRSKAPMQKGIVRQLVASRAPWIITRSEGDDTEIRVHSYDGDLLATLDTKQVQNLQLSVSGDGCFFGCAAWAPGVKVFEVKAKGGAFQKVEKAMDIRSSQGLMAFAISPDRTRAALADKSGNLSLWRTDVRHNVGEDTKLVCQTAVKVASTASTSLHFTLDGGVLILATGADLHFFIAATLQLFKVLQEAPFTIITP